MLEKYKLKDEFGNKRRKNVKFINILIRVLCPWNLFACRDGRIFFSQRRDGRGSMMRLITWSRVVMDVQGMKRRVIS
jgi:hypothetical protein